MSYTNLAEKGELLYKITSSLEQVKNLRNRKNWYRANYWAGGLEVMIHIYRDTYGNSPTVDRVENEMVRMGH